MDNTSPNKEKIQKYLDELSKEYKELLYSALIERSQSIDDISISELLRIDNEIKKPLHAEYQRQKHRRKLYISVGLIYVALGFMMFLFYSIIGSDLFFSIDSAITLVSLIITLAGICVIIIAFVLPMNKDRIRKNSNYNKIENNKYLSYDVIIQWRELEGIVDDLAERNNVFTPRSIIQYLTSNNFIDKEEALVLREFLKIRNSIVHSSDVQFSFEEIEKVTQKVERIISKLKKIL